jgi:hypothetical protein
MTERPGFVVDRHFRAMGDLFSSQDARRLADVIAVVWGGDEPITQAVAR